MDKDKAAMYALKSFKDLGFETGYNGNIYDGVLKENVNRIWVKNGGEEHALIFTDKIPYSEGMIDKFVESIRGKIQ